MDDLNYWKEEVIKMQRAALHNRVDALMDKRLDMDDFIDQCRDIYYSDIEKNAKGLSRMADEYVDGKERLE